MKLSTGDNCKSSAPLLPILRPGDHLLYYTNCLADWIICVKTWSDVGHIEVFAGYGDSPHYPCSVAARAKGVDLFPFRSPGLRYVLRPKVWNEAEAWKWFQGVAKGQKYDWLGLLCFSLAVKQGRPHHMFCSEFARNLDRAAGCPSFADDWPGDLTPPMLFKSSDAFTRIYDHKLDYYVPAHHSDWRKAK